MKDVIILNWGNYDANSTHTKFKTENYRLSYEQLYTYAHQNGIRLIKTHYKTFKDGKFIWGWSFDPFAKEWNKVYDIDAKLVLDKAKTFDESLEYKELIEKHVKIINPVQMTRELYRKDNQHKIFGDLMPKTIFYDEQSIEEIKNIFILDEVVVKPVAGSGGKDIIIKKKSDLSEEDRGKIIQEFITTDKGLEGFETHDIRIIILDGEPMACIVRTPKEGSKLCNVQQGANVSILDEIPEQIKLLISKIDEKVKKFQPRFYSADFFISNNQKAYLIEVNLSPGFFFYQKHQAIRNKFFKQLINALKDAI
jgi:glutathione synthase/RimK-type ligase-like ATP-grasp enzyme